MHEPESIEMVIYEVNLQVDASVADAYLPWLQAHVRQMLTLPGFERATLFAVDDPPTAVGVVHWCVQYRLRDRAALDGYLHDHAGAMRAEGLQRFGAAVRASRRVLLPV